VSFINYFAETAAAPEASGSLLSALGIDWRLLILQIVAFLILVFLLGKFVYPWLMKQVDERQVAIEAAAKAATEAQASAAESKDRVTELLAEARSQAADIVSTAKLEAAQMLSASEERARSTAEKIAADAQANVKKSIETAKRELHDETLELIALATEKVIHTKLDKKADDALIVSALKELK
jgi:F-type H+-transporting ATPase subunit b